MDRILSVTKYFVFAIIGIIILAAFVYTNNKVGALSENYADSRMYLTLNSDKYIRCYNTTNYGQSMLMDVTIDRLKFDTTDTVKEKMNQLEKDFLAIQIKNCGNTVDKYEQEYKNFTTSIQEYDQLGLLKLFGSSSAPLEDDDSLNPARLRFSAGNPLTTLTYTREEAEKYFDDNL